MRSIADDEVSININRKGVIQWARILSLHSALLITISGCAPFMHGAASLSGGASGSGCEFEGLLRGSDCYNAITSVYLSDQKWRERPRVCGWLMTWGALGMKKSHRGDDCFDDLPTYCQSSVLIPGLNNQVLKNHDAIESAQLEKEVLCSLPMTAQLFIYKGARFESKIKHVWSNSVFTNEYGKEILIQKPGEDVESYCRSSVLIPGVDEQMLKNYDVLNEAMRKKTELCAQPR